MGLHGVPLKFFVFYLSLPLWASLSHQAEEPTLLQPHALGIASSPEQFNAKRLGFLGLWLHF